MRRLLPLLILALLFSGCAGRQMEEETVVIALAVDQTEEGQYRLAVKAPSAAQQQGQDEQMGYWTLLSSGSTFGDAVALLNASTPRKLNFAQVREVIVNDAAAGSESLPRLLQAIAALPRLRTAAAVIVCRGSACDMAEKLKPYMGLRLSRYAEDSLSDAAGKGFTPATTLAQALRDLGSGLRDPLFILGAVNDFANDQPESVLSAQAGALPRKSPDPIDLFGAAVTDGKKMAGVISGDEMALLHLLTGGGHFYSAILENTSVTLRARGRAEMHIDLSRRPIRLQLRLLCGADAANAAVDLDKAAAEVRGRILSLLKKLQSLRCDALGFGDLAVRRCWTDAAWKQMDFKRLYEEAEFDCILTLRRQSD